MYKFLLCWRYLRTRYIALASIISVTLGVATLIIVNSVMAGFSEEMHKRLNGILSDIVFESHSLSGFPNPEWHKQEIAKVIGDDLEAMTATVHVPAMLSINVNGEYLNRQITLIGIDTESYAGVSDFSKFLLHPENREKLEFRLRETGYAPDRKELANAGWEHRRTRIRFEQALREQYELEARRQAESQGIPQPENDSAAAETGQADEIASDPYAGSATEGSTFDPLKEQHSGIIVGIAICSQKHRDENDEIRDYFFCKPGDDVRVTLPNAASPPRPVDDVFTVVDFYESQMSEYDSSFAFVPLDKIQDLRGMVDPSTQVKSVTSIQIKLREGADLNAVRDKIQARFPITHYPYRINTWRDLQGPLLSAVQLETTILNILLFLIIAVAGFGILATFFMIVVEKTKDIGILKSLGAPSGGVMSIFLSYGISLGAVGSGAGMILGLLFVKYINEIASGLEWITGREVFDPTVYYFQSIPTIIDPFTVGGVVLGAVLIAVLASVLPARHAARLHPVEALRYE